MWTPDVCLYHFPCDDGFAAAWVVKKAFPNVVLAPTNYGLPIPDVEIDGRNILIADFSYKPAVLADLARRARQIVILDHHKSAAEDLAAFRVEMCGGARFCAADVEGMFRDFDELSRPAIAACFEMNRSGAGLAWDFCYPHAAAPLFIRLIEDRDLWRMAMPQTRRFSLFLRSHPYDLRVWDEISRQLEERPAELHAEARGIERYFDRRLAELVPTATLRDIGRWKGVPVAHAPYAFASDLANELLKYHPEAPFAAVVVEARGGRTWSLRSEDARQDVSEVARQFGGGGHRNAAGFRTPV